MSNNNLRKRDYALDYICNTSRSLASRPAGSRRWGVYPSVARDRGRRPIDQPSWRPTTTLTTNPIKGAPSADQ